MDFLQRRLKRAQADLKSGAVENLLSLRKSAAAGGKSIRKVEEGLRNYKSIVEGVSSDSSTSVVIAFKRRASPQLKSWLQEKIAQEVPELQVTPIRFAHRQRDALLVSITEEGMWIGAEERMLQKKVKKKFGGGRRRFTILDRDRFLNSESVNAFFSTSDQQSMVAYFLTNIRLTASETCNGFSFDPGVSIVASCMTKNIISQVYPLHSRLELDSLRRQWIQKRSIISQPIDSVRHYFGLMIAFYFSWLLFYTKALVAPAIFGTLLYVILYRTAGTPEEVRYECIVAVCLSLFNVVWSTVFLEMWKQRSSEIAFEWGVLDTSIEQNTLNPLFKSVVASNPVTGNLEMKPLTLVESMKKRCVTTPILVVAICVSTAVMLAVFSMRDYIQHHYSDNAIVLLIPQVVLSLLIVVQSFGYRRLALWLTLYENHRLKEDFDTAIIVKLAVFQLINSYLILFYIAFWRQDLDVLKTQLAALLITRQLIKTVQQTVVPYATQYAKKMHLAGQACSNVLDHDEVSAEDLPDEVKSRLSAPELESVMGQYLDPISDYMEMLVQFGYVVLFSGAFPLAGLLCLINNIVEMRTDAFKLCFSYQRPFSLKVNGIGVWQTAFEVLGYVAVAVNCAMLVVFGRFEQWLPGLSYTQIIVLLVIGEHLFLALKSGIMMVIPDVPQWVTVELQRTEHLQQEAILNEWRRQAFQDKYTDGDEVEDDVQGNGGGDDDPGEETDFSTDV